MMGRMAVIPRQFTGVKFLLSVAAFVVIVAGLKAAASIMVPFLLAVFVVILVAPAYFWMQAKGVPSWAALLVMILVMLGLGVFGASFFTSAVNSFARNLPSYQIVLTHQLEEGVKLLRGYGMDLPENAVEQTLDPQRFFGFARTIAGSVTVILGNALVITLVAIFMLLEAARLPAKIRALPGMTDERWGDFIRIMANVRQYMAMKTVMSLLTGGLVTLLLWVLGVDYPVLLGVLAFFFNYVPSIGSIIAALPGILLAFVLHGPLTASLCIVGYVVINVGISNFLEPRYMGRGLGLSPLMIILSLFFWGWVLGPVGMLLSVPLMMVFKVALETSPNTRSLASLLSDVVPDRAKPLD